MNLSDIKSLTFIVLYSPFAKYTFTINEENSGGTVLLTARIAFAWFALKMLLGVVWLAFEILAITVIYWTFGVNALWGLIATLFYLVLRRLLWECFETTAKFKEDVSK